MSKESLGLSELDNLLSDVSQSTDGSEMGAGSNEALEDVFEQTMVFLSSHKEINKQHSQFFLKLLKAVSESGMDEETKELFLKLLEYDNRDDPLKVDYSFTLDHLNDLFLISNSIDDGAIRNKVGLSLTSTLSSLLTEIVRKGIRFSSTLFFSALNKQFSHSSALSLISLCYSTLTKNLTNNSSLYLLDFLHLFVETELSISHSRIGNSNLIRFIVDNLAYFLRDAEKNNILISPLLTKILNSCNHGKDDIDYSSLIALSFLIICVRVYENEESARTSNQIQQQFDGLIQSVNEDVDLSYLNKLQNVILSNLTNQSLKAICTMLTSLREVDEQTSLSWCSALLSSHASEEGISNSLHLLSLLSNSNSTNIQDKSLSFLYNLLSSESMVFTDKQYHFFLNDFIGYSKKSKQESSPIKERIEKICIQLLIRSLDSQSSWTSFFNFILNSTSGNMSLSAIDTIRESIDFEMLSDIAPNLSIKFIVRLLSHEHTKTDDQAKSYTKLMLFFKDVLGNFLSSPEIEHPGALLKSILKEIHENQSLSHEFMSIFLQKLDETPENAFYILDQITPIVVKSLEKEHKLPQIIQIKTKLTYLYANIGKMLESATSFINCLVLLKETLGDKDSAEEINVIESFADEHVTQIALNLQESQAIEQFILSLSQFRGDIPEIIWQKILLSFLEHGLTKFSFHFISVFLAILHQSFDDDDDILIEKWMMVLNQHPLPPVTKVQSALTLLTYSQISTEKREQASLEYIYENCVSFYLDLVGRNYLNDAFQMSCTSLKGKELKISTFIKLFTSDKIQNEAAINPRFYLEKVATYTDPKLDFTIYSFKKVVCNTLSISEDFDEELTSLLRELISTAPRYKDNAFQLQCYEIFSELSKRKFAAFQSSIENYLQIDDENIHGGEEKILSLFSDTLTDLGYRSNAFEDTSLEKDNLLKSLNSIDEFIWQHISPLLQLKYGKVALSLLSNYVDFLIEMGLDSFQRPLCDKIVSLFSDEEIKFSKVNPVAQRNLLDSLLSLSKSLGDQELYAIFGMHLIYANITQKRVQNLSTLLTDISSFYQGISSEYYLVLLQFFVELHISSLPPTLNFSSTAPENILEEKDRLLSLFFTSDNYPIQKFEESYLQDVLSLILTLLFPLETPGTASYVSLKYLEILRGVPFDWLTMLSLLSKGLVKVEENFESLTKVVIEICTHHFIPERIANDDLKERLSSLVNLVIDWKLSSAVSPLFSRLVDGIKTGVIAPADIFESYQRIIQYTLDENLIDIAQSISDSLIKELIIVYSKHQIAVEDLRSYKLFFGIFSIVLSPELPLTFAKLVMDHFVKSSKITDSIQICLESISAFIDSSDFLSTEILVDEMCTLFTTSANYSHLSSFFSSVCELGKFSPSIIGLTAKKARASILDASSANNFTLIPEWQNIILSIIPYLYVNTQEGLKAKEGEDTTALRSMIDLMASLWDSLEISKFPQIIPNFIDLLDTLAFYRESGTSFVLEMLNDAILNQSEGILDQRIYVSMARLSSRKIEDYWNRFIYSSLKTSSYDVCLYLIQLAEIWNIISIPDHILHEFLSSLPDLTSHILNRSEPSLLFSFLSLFPIHFQGLFFETTSKVIRELIIEQNSFTDIKEEVVEIQIKIMNEVVKLPYSEFSLMKEILLFLSDFIDLIPQKQIHALLVKCIKAHINNGDLEEFRKSFILFMLAYTSHFTDPKGILPVLEQLEAFVIQKKYFSFWVLFAEYNFEFLISSSAWDALKEKYTILVQSNSVPIQERLEVLNNSLLYISPEDVSNNFMQYLVSFVASKYNFSFKLAVIIQSIRICISNQNFTELANEILIFLSERRKITGWIAQYTNTLLPIVCSELDNEVRELLQEIILYNYDYSDDNRIYEHITYIFSALMDDARRRSEFDVIKARLVILFSSQDASSSDTNYIAQQFYELVSIFKDGKQRSEILTLISDELMKENQPLKFEFRLHLLRELIHTAEKQALHQLLLHSFSMDESRKLSTEEIEVLWQGFTEGHLDFILNDSSYFSFWIEKVCASTSLDHVKQLFNFLCVSLFIHHHRTHLLFERLSTLYSFYQENRGPAYHEYFLEAILLAMRDNLSLVQEKDLIQISKMGWIGEEFEIIMILLAHIVSMVDDPHSSLDFVTSLVTEDEETSKLVLDKKIKRNTFPFLSLWLIKFTETDEFWLLSELDYRKFVFLIGITDVWPELSKELAQTLTQIDPFVSEEQFIKVRSFFELLFASLSRNIDQSDVQAVIDCLNLLSEVGSNYPGFASDTLSIVFDFQQQTSGAPQEETVKRFIESQIAILSDETTMYNGISLLKKTLKAILDTHQHSLLNNFQNVVLLAILQLFESLDQYEIQEISAFLLSDLLPHTPDSGRNIFSTILYLVNSQITSGFTDAALYVLKHMFTEISSTIVFSLKSELSDFIKETFLTLWKQGDIYSLQWFTKLIIRSDLLTQLWNEGERPFQFFFNDLGNFWGQNARYTCKLVSLFLPSENSSNLLPEMYVLKVMSLAESSLISGDLDNISWITPLVSHLPVSPTLVKNNFPQFINTLRDSTSPTLIQFGSYLISGMICASYQFLSLTSPDNQSELDHIDSVFHQLISFSSDEIDGYSLMWIPIIQSNLTYPIAKYGDKIFNAFLSLCETEQYSLLNQLLHFSSVETIYALRVRFVLKLIELGKKSLSFSNCVFAILLGSMCKKKDISRDISSILEDQIKEISDYRTLSLTILTHMEVTLEDTSISKSTRYLDKATSVLHAFYTNDISTAKIITESFLTKEKMRKRDEINYRLAQVLLNLYLSHSSSGNLNKKIADDLLNIKNAIENDNSQYLWLVFLSLSPDIQEHQEFMESVVEEVFSYLRTQKDLDSAQCTRKLRILSQIIAAAGFDISSSLIRRRASNYLHAILHDDNAIYLASDIPVLQLPSILPFLQRLKLKDSDLTSSIRYLISFTEDISKATDYSNLLHGYDYASSILSTNRLAEFVLPVLEINSNLTDNTLNDLSNLVETISNSQENIVRFLLDSVVWQDLHRGILIGKIYFTGAFVSNFISDVTKHLNKNGWWSWDVLSGTYNMPTSLQNLDVLPRTVQPYYVSSTNHRYFDPDWLIKQRRRNPGLAVSEFISEFSLKESDADMIDRSGKLFK